LDEPWVERRIAETQAALKGTANEVPEAVVREFATLLSNDLQIKLKPEELRRIVSKLAEANRRGE
jgi:hypothetical protein